MLYLDDSDVKRVRFEWPSAIAEISNAVESIARGEFAQPVKPYLRYGDLKNRIIAMPAYVAHPRPMAGLKWIASFPDNPARGLPRAHSVTVLNEPQTGVPLATFCSGTLSAVRTAAVTGSFMQHALPCDARGLRIGITGFGPIGQTHLDMLFGAFDSRIEQVRLFDVRGVDLRAVPPAVRDRVRSVECWEDAYKSDVFITCTVASSRYVDRPPPRGSLQLNISLRDYLPSIRDHVAYMVVDDWDEVCRENTDIELMHKECGLQRRDTLSLADVVIGHALAGRSADQVVMLNPMGMAVFDVTLGALYVELARRQGIGIELGRREP